MMDALDDDNPTFAILRQRMIDHAVMRGTAKTICPSETARSFGRHWRDLMPRVHQVAERLCTEGVLEYVKGDVGHGQHRPSGHYRLRIIAQNTP